MWKGTIERQNVPGGEIDYLSVRMHPDMPPYGLHRYRPGGLVFVQVASGAKDREDNPKVRVLDDCLGIAPRLPVPLAR